MTVTSTTPHGPIAVLEQVPVNETRQWVLIRSEDTRHPLVLFVHGGPGTAQLTLMRRNTRPLERFFTVVNWDQRGAGKSFRAGADPARMTVAQFVDDVIDLSSYLARRFQNTEERDRFNAFMIDTVLLQIAPALAVAA